jgi:hypothetical protein
MPPPGCTMVRNLTAHRVFPAKETGGNGIAGTSVVPGYSLNNTLKAPEAAMTFLLPIELYKTTRLTWFRPRCDGRPRPVLVGVPGVRRAGWDSDSRQESRQRRRNIPLPTKGHFSFGLTPLSTSLVLRWRLVGWMRRECVALGRCLNS